jgi:hypothetical protein
MAGKLHHSWTWPAEYPVSTFADMDRRKEAALEEARAIADAKANAAALRALAERAYPDEMAETAKRWGMETYMREVWCQAYMRGWRDAALSTVFDLQTESGK